MSLVSTYTHFLVTGKAPFTTLRISFTAKSERMIRALFNNDLPDV